MAGKEGRKETVGKTEQMKWAARKGNLTACLCCAKIHKKSGENLLKLVIEFSKKERWVNGFLQSFPEITHIFHEFVIP